MMSNRFTSQALAQGRRMGVLLSIATALQASTGQARPEYSGRFQDAAQLACAPTCVTCHVDPNGGTNWNAFGARMVGPIKGEQLAWPQLVERLRAMDVDSDADGVLDMVELDNGTNPTLAGAVPLGCPSYGCGARISAAPPHSPLAGSLTLGALALLLVRLRRRPCRGAAASKPVQDAVARSIW